MEFKIITLIDITETGCNRGPETVEYSQQANFNTVVQTIGLRANPTPKWVKQRQGGIGNLDFGSAYSGRHNYWEFVFEIEYGLTNIEDLIKDFNMVPVITSLNETIQLNTSVFDTSNKETKNIMFEQLS